MEKLKNKLTETEGATFIQIAALFLFGMVCFSIVFEFVRVKLVVQNVKDAYLRAVRTVASENYNEVHAGFREEVSTGGQYIGGPEGGGDEEKPEWESMHDYGDVRNELEELLKLKDEKKRLISEEGGYELSDFEVKVMDASDSILRRYEVTGQLRLKVFFSVGGIAVSELQLPLKVQTKYEQKY